MTYKRIGTHMILDGRDVLFDFEGCSMENVKHDIAQLLQENNIVVLQSIFHDFMMPRGAFTGIFLLSESHLSIHTFPEERYIAIDLYTCNLEYDRTSSVEAIIGKLIQYFSIRAPEIQTFRR